MSFPQYNYSSISTSSKMEYRLQSGPLDSWGIEASKGDDTVINAMVELFRLHSGSRSDEGTDAISSVEQSNLRRSQEAKVLSTQHEDEDKRALTLFQEYSGMFNRTASIIFGSDPSIDASEFVFPEDDYEHLHMSNINHVSYPNVAEEFWISSYPDSKPIYWNEVFQRNLEIGVQLELRGTNYHVPLGDVYDLGEGRSVRLIETREICLQGRHRVYEILHAQASSRIFHHLSLAWPDLGLPQQESFLELMKTYLHLVRPSMQVHVHCRAGMGRSGTFVFSRVLLNNLFLQSPQNVLVNLRKQRFGLVETPAQERFAIECADILLDELTPTAENLERRVDEKHAQIHERISDNVVNSKHDNNATYFLPLAPAIAQETYKGSQVG